MRNGRHTLVFQFAAALLLLGLLATEIYFIHHEKLAGEAFAKETERIGQEIRAMGPLVASKEDLEACESDFLDKLARQPRIPYATVSGKARATLELARTLAECGLGENEAADAAAILGASPEASLIVMDLSRVEGLRLRAVQSNREGVATGWTFDITCNAPALAELFSTIGNSAGGVALDGMDLRPNGDDVDIRLQLESPEKKEVRL